MRVVTWTVGIIVLLVGVGGTPLHGEPEKSRPLEVEPEDLRPGLVAHYRSLTDKEASLYRIDAKPAFRLDHSSPHPRIPPGPFEVVWIGMVNLVDPAPLTFDASVCGDVTMELDGVVVLQGSGERETTQIRSREPLNRPRGLYRLRIRYRALPGLPARLQIGWQGRTFSRELLPAWHLKHLAADLSPDALQDQLAEKGRAATGRLGCARCHSGAFPGVADPPPGPSLADAGRRINRAWLLEWLENPAKMRPDARMPALFDTDRKGFVERWILTEHLLGSSSSGKRPAAVGDHRLGRREFISIGCATCHFLPDQERSAQPDFSRTALADLADRLPAEDLASFLGNPHSRYPDGRMPRLPVPPDMARNIAAYLLLWSKPARMDVEVGKPPTADEIAGVSRRLGARGHAATAAALIREKHCAECHPGFGATLPASIPIKRIDDNRGCLSDRSVPRFRLDAPTRKAIAAYQAVAAWGKALFPVCQPSASARTPWLSPLPPARQRPAAADRGHRQHPRRRLVAIPAVSADAAAHVCLPEIHADASAGVGTRGRRGSASRALLVSHAGFRP